eukprot:9431200-Alexandrium_andersonii.AAC.1
MLTGTVTKKEEPTEAGGGAEPPQEHVNADALLDQMIVQHQNQGSTAQLLIMQKMMASLATVTETVNNLQQRE